MTFRNLLFLIFIGCFSSAQSQSIDLSKLNQSKGFLFFNGKTSYVVSDTVIPLESLRYNATILNWKQTPEEPFIYDDYNEKYYSYKFILSNKDTIERNVVCMFGGRGIGEASIGQVSAGDWKYIDKTGYTVPLEERPLPYARFTFPITISPGSIDTIYISIDERRAYKVIGFVLFDAELMASWQQTHNLQMGWIFGVLTIFLLLNFFLFASLGERIHLWYAFYLIGAIGFFIKFEGIEVYFPGLDSKWGFRLTPMAFFSVIALACLVKTLRHYVPPSKTWKRWIFVGDMLFYLSVLAAILFLLSFAIESWDAILHIIYPKILILNIILVSFILLFCIKILYHRVPGGWFIFTGLSLVMVGAMLRSFLTAGSVDLLPPFLFEYGLVAEAIIISFGLMYRYNLFRKERNTLAIELKAKELEVTKQLVETLEAEHERVARDLHDELSGNLAALQLHIHASTLHADEKRNIEAIMHHAALSARRIAHNLMPPGFEQTTLNQLLKSFFDQFAQVKDLKVNYFFASDVPELLPSQSLMVYRIILELVNNIIKHANATEASVQISIVEDQYRILVEDNGIGLDGQKAEGMGLKNIRSRVAFLNGVMEIDSSPFGTSVIISFPFKNIIKF